MKEGLNIVLLAVGLFLVSFSTAYAHDGLTSHTVEHEGQERSYLRYVPPSIHQADGPVPLVVLLHGGGGAGRSMMRYTRFNRLASDSGYIVVYPSGLNRHWNDGRERYQGPDDVGFIKQVINETIAETSRVDQQRIFVTGMSNGGHMSQRLACEQAELFAGIAVVTAQFTPELMARCQPSRPIAVLYINGTEDPLVPYDGGAIAAKWGSRGTVTSTAATIDFWQRHNGCSETPSVSLLPDRDAGDDIRVEQQDWAGCATNAPLRLYRIVGGGHTWPGKMQYLPEAIIGPTTNDVDANDLIDEFFRSLQ
jgi:polyhydroxybutyrate depolymerase